MKNKIIAVFIALLCPLFANAATSQLKEISIKEKSGVTHLEFLLSKPVKWQAFALSHPERVIVDFQDVDAAFNVSHLTYPKTRLVKIRKGYPKPHVLRIVLEINPGVHYQKASHESVRKVKIDLLSKEKSVVKENHFKPLVIVIDPGHGGKDPGAVGQNGTKEKDVVLPIARMLADRINEDPGMRAVLTRNGDYFVSLRKRLQMARQYKADLFIAIHADSYFNNNAAGASVYSLSNHGASSVAARWLAQRENHSELGGIDLNDLEDQSTLLRSVMLDLAQTATHKASIRCGASLLDSLNDVTRLHYSRVEQAPFMVLKSPDIPSVLVETGFISNINEEKRLKNKKHQAKMAEALFVGVTNFQKKYLVKEG